MAAQDEALVRKEQQAVNYIRKNIDLDDIQVVEKVYNQLKRQATFQTPVGLNFLQELAEKIATVRAEEAQKTDPETGIKLNLYTKDQVLAELKKVRAIQQKKVQLLTTSTIILTVMVIVMFIITATSKLPTIINYKQMVTDEYANWDMELRNREDEVRRREQEVLEKEEQVIQQMNQLNQATNTYYNTEDMDALNNAEDVAQDTEETINDEE